MLLKYALYLTKDKESADELLEETVVHAYMRRDKFTAGTKPGRWLSVIMRNLYFNYKTRKKQVISYVEYMEMIKEIDNDTPEEQLIIHDINKYIDSLTPELREPIRLRMSGMSYIEIAQELTYQ